MTKKEILSEIRRTAAENGGAPLGIRTMSKPMILPVLKLFECKAGIAVNCSLSSRARFAQGVALTR